MRKAGRKLIEGMRALIRPLPSFFDVCVAGFLGIVLFKDTYKQSIHFIFYIIFLLSLTIGMKYRRQYKSTPLALLIIWALICVFLHSYVIYEDSITMKYLNMYLMSEGFIYILFGIIFIKITATYSKNLKFLFLLIPLAMIPWLREGRMTIIASFAFATLIYFIINKKIWQSISLVVLMDIISRFNWHRILKSFDCRPLVWKDLIRRMIQHPFVGEGFDNSLKPANAVFNTKWGGVYMHCDILNIGRCLGVISMIFIAWFILQNTWMMRKSKLLIIFLAFVLCSTFQMTMPIPWKAAIVLTAVSLTINETLKKGVV